MYPVLPPDRAGRTGPGTIPETRTMTIHPTSPPLLSILIPTLPERQDSFSRLTRKLRAQIDATESGDRVEILDFLDSREHTIGAKRNWLLDRARGEFVAFVDDDDDVSERYVDLIRHAIEDHPEIDCVGIKGTISFRGRIERTFVHSIRFRDYRSRGDVPTPALSSQSHPSRDRPSVSVRGRQLLRGRRLGDDDVPRWGALRRVLRG